MAHLFTYEAIERKEKSHKLCGCTTELLFKIVFFSFFPCVSRDYFKQLRFEKAGPKKAKAYSSQVFRNGIRTSM